MQDSISAACTGTEMLLNSCGSSESSENVKNLLLIYVNLRLMFADQFIYILSTCIHVDKGLTCRNILVNQNISKEDVK